MNIKFWQNIVSPHQVDVLTRLGEENQVSLIVENEIDDFRKKQNWDTNIPQNITFFANPHFRKIYNLLKNDRDTIHIFSGYLSYKKISIAFIMAILMRRKVYIISEAAKEGTFSNKIIFFVRKLLTYFLKSKVKGVFVAGSQAYKYFEKLGFSEDVIHEYGYFVDVKGVSFVDYPKRYLKLIFVGRLVAYKGVEELVRAFSFLQSIDPNYELEIIGDGDLRNALNGLVKTLDIKNISFKKDIPRIEVLDKIASSGTLLLPNTGLEGWGVVINESLLVGTSVVCSENTGAKVIVDTSYQGKVISSVNSKSISSAILTLKNVDRLKIKDLANHRISSSKIAEYLTKIFKNQKIDQNPWV